MYASHVTDEMRIGLRIGRLLVGQHAILVFRRVLKCQRSSAAGTIGSPAMQSSKTAPRWKVSGRFTMYRRPVVPEPQNGCGQRFRIAPAQLTQTFVTASLAATTVAKAKAV